MSSFPHAIIMHVKHDTNRQAKTLLEQCRSLSTRFVGPTRLAQLGHDENDWLGDEGTSGGEVGDPAR